jgi:putative transcriptional regulator
MRRHAAIGAAAVLVVSPLLVATPALRDPNFERTVILVLDHDEDGALGVVLNRASTVTVRDTRGQEIDGACGQLAAQG